MGSQTFTKVQYGFETTCGSAAAATGRWPGTVDVPPDRKPEFPSYMTGTRSKLLKGTINQIGVEGMSLKMDAGVFQALPMLFSMGLKGGVTAAEQTTSQGDYLWDFSHSLTATNNLESVTLEFGDDTQAYETEYVMCTGYKISGATGDNSAVSVEATAFGKQITPTTFTSSVSLLAAGIETMAGNMAKIWIDPTWANLGSTQKTSLLRDFSIEILTGVTPNWFANGQKTMTAHSEGYLDARLTLTFEGNASADTEFDIFQAGTSRAIRLQILGSQIGSGSAHSLTFDCFGTYEEIKPLGSEKNGNNLHTVVFQTHSNGLSTPNHFAVKVITNRNTK